MRVLITDDDPELRDNLAEALSGAGHAVACAASGEEALQQLDAAPRDLLLLDLMMPGMDGMETLARVRRDHPRVPVIILTAFAAVETAVEAVKRGAADYLAKPVKREQLLLAIRRTEEEARFARAAESANLDDTLASLSNALRRGVIRLLASRGAMRLKEMLTALEVNDHTKLLFHLRSLRNAGLLEQNEERAYRLTGEGQRMHTALDLLQTHIGSSDADGHGR